MFYCDEWDYSAINKKTLKKHKEKSHEPKECDVCGDNFIREIDLRDHMRPAATSLPVH